MMSDSIPLTRIQNTEISRFLTEELPRPISPHPDVFQHSLALDEASLAAIQPSWKRSLHALLEHPTSSPSAFLVHIVMTCLIITSAVVTVLETVPAFHSISVHVWFGLETTLVALFTVEYICRCVAWSGTWTSLAKWVFSFFGIIDLLAILPYYIEILLQQDTSVFFRFSILRMFRLLRVFKPFRYNHTILLTIEVMYLSVRRSQHALLAIGFFVVMVLTVFSTLLYFTERGTWDETLETFINYNGDPTQFASIPAAAWFVLVTITTVGYGEITPRTFLGRLVTLPLLVFGLLLIALPSFVLGREFSLVWEKMATHHNDNNDVMMSPVLSRHPFRSQGVDTPRPHSDGNSSENKTPDLTNLKLAQNQTELSGQISELRSMVEMQGDVIRRLVTALEGKGKERARES